MPPIIKESNKIKRMEQKLLSICFPTYNRAECIGEQLKRLYCVDKSVLKDVEIIVSDNCSTDKTKDVILSYKDKLEFQYNRNERNLGPDENYLYCFSHATGKYIWLVGDDDYLIPYNLHVVIDTLKDKDLGFLYIKPRANSEKPAYKAYNSKELFFDEIGIHITFLTSSVIRSDYVKDVDVTPYKGTWQEYVPFFFTSIVRGETNGELLFCIYEDPAASDTNGGYKIFNVFGVGFLRIVEDFYKQGKISKRVFEIERNASFNFLKHYAYRLLVEHQKSNFIVKDAWPTLNKLFGRWRVKCSMLRICVGKTIKSLYAILFEIQS